MMTTFDVDGETPEPEFTDRRDLAAGDEVEIRVNGTPTMKVRVKQGASFDAVIVVSGTARTV